jgi:hypothetical protein
MEVTRPRSTGNGRFNGLAHAGGVPPIATQAEPFQSHPLNVVGAGVVGVVVGVVVTGGVVVVGLVGVVVPPPPPPQPGTAMETHNAKIARRLSIF